MFKWFKIWRAKFIENEDTREKEIATINNKPWVKVLNVEFSDADMPNVGSMELDWNDAFIKQLTDNGYSGRTESDIVDMWFRDICRGIINEET